jgi:isocitrate lyase
MEVNEVQVARCDNLGASLIQKVTVMERNKMDDDGE